MLGRKDYTKDELEAAKTAVEQTLAAYDDLTRPSARATAVYFANAVLAFDRRFVHRLRGVTGKDGTPLNELELLTDSLMNHDGVMRGINVITYDADKSVLGFSVGDRIALTAEQFSKLADGVFAELEQKYR